MYYAITLFGEPGSEIIYPDPGFPIYESMINYTGAKAVPINILENKDFSMNPQKILSLINDKTRLIILNNHYSLKLSRQYAGLLCAPANVTVVPGLKSLGKKAYFQRNT